MIPKVIHYCWFGKSKMPDLAIKCIDSWRKFLPDYKLKIWNEDNFDVNSIPYVKEAYEVRKFAFVTDYVRLYALYKDGGIYMDTDVEVLKSLDDLLELSAFSGYESNKFSNFPTGIMASQKGGIWVKEQLDYYDGKHFFNPDGTYDMTTNTVTISNIMVSNGFKLDGKYRIYKNDMHCFPKDFFCPKTSTGVIKITGNSYCIHHFANSWREKGSKEKIMLFVFRKLINPSVTDKLIIVKRKLTTYLKKIALADE
jgi:mannosyltransferase OCH1-like enzyme